MRGWKMATWWASRPGTRRTPIGRCGAAAVVITACRSRNRARHPANPWTLRRLSGMSLANEWPPSPRWLDGLTTKTPPGWGLWHQAGDDLSAVSPVDAEVGIGGDYHRVGQRLAQTHQAGVGQAHGHAGVLGSQVEHVA